jgi:hypothetical protein
MISACVLSRSTVAFVMLYFLRLQLVNLETHKGANNRRESHSVCRNRNPQTRKAQKQETKLEQAEQKEAA